MDPEKELEPWHYLLVYHIQYSRSSDSRVDMNTLCILSWDNLTVFVTAGITHPDQADPAVSDSLYSWNDNIIVLVQGFHDQALVDAVITVTEAKALALRDAGFGFVGTVTDAVLIASEGSGPIRYAGVQPESDR